MHPGAEHLRTSQCCVRTQYAVVLLPLTHRDQLVLPASSDTYQTSHPLSLIHTRVKPNELTSADAIPITRHRVRGMRRPLLPQGPTKRRLARPYPGSP